MAGLIGLKSSDIEIQDALRVPRWKYGAEWIPHPVVRLTTTLPVAINEPDGRSIVRARWGIPGFDGRPLGNARDDGLLEKRTWKALVGRNPCLVPATAIYEQVRKTTKTSYWFRRVDGKPIVMPGLWKEYASEDGERRVAMAIVTTSPNRFFAQFHDRQVCALAPAEFDAWMTETDPARAVKLLHAPGDDEWEAVPVDDRIFSHGRRELEDLVPLGPPVRWT